eukprot:495184-Pleurochrysis_carterae.AAC.2
MTTATCVEWRRAWPAVWRVVWRMASRLASHVGSTLALQAVLDHASFLSTCRRSTASSLAVRMPAWTAWASSARRASASSGSSRSDRPQAGRPRGSSGAAPCRAHGGQVAASTVRAR